MANFAVLTPNHSGVSGVSGVVSALRAKIQNKCMNPKNTRKTYFMRDSLRNGQNDPTDPTDPTMGRFEPCCGRDGCWKDILSEVG